MIHVKKMVKVAIGDSDKRWNINGRSFLVLCKCAMAFDPRFKNTLKESDQDTVDARKLVDKHLKQIEQKQKEQNSKKRHREIMNEDSEEEEDSQPPHKKVKTNSFLMAMRTKYTSPQDKDEYEQFKQEPSISFEDDPLKWWAVKQSRYPTIAKLATRYLMIPATSVPCESLFSYAGHLVNKKRTSLTSDSVRDIMFLHENQQHVFLDTSSVQDE